MSRGFILALVIGGLGLLSFLLWTQTDISSKFANNKASVEHVQFSVVRYNGKIISARLMIDGSGKLQTRHRITKDDVGIAIYEQGETIISIQKATNARYIVSANGFTHEVIDKEVELE